MSTPFLVKDIFPGVGKSSKPSNLNAVGNVLYFKATVKDNTYDDEVWKSDGTALGTEQVFANDTDGKNEFPSVPSGSTVLFYSKPMNPQTNKLYFSDIQNKINTSLDFSDGLYLYGDYTASMGDSLYFIASNTGLSPDLWKTNGATAGTSLVYDNNKISTPSKLTVFKDKLYFLVDNNLYEYDGISPADKVWWGAGFMEAQGDLVSVGSYLYYVHNEDLWAWDGAAGTQQKMSPNGIQPSNLTAVGSKLFFTAKAVGGNTGFELWCSTGPGGTTKLVKDIEPGAGNSGIDKIIAAGDKCYLYRKIEDPNDPSVPPKHELWVSNGEENGTLLLGEFAQKVTDLVVVGGLLYFSADDGENGTELWQSDGTKAGTKMVYDLNPGSADGLKIPGAGGDSHLEAAGNTLFFLGDDGSGKGQELWGLALGGTEKSPAKPAAKTTTAAQSNAVAQSVAALASLSSVSSATAYSNLDLSIASLYKAIKGSATLAKTTDKISKAVSSALTNNGITLSDKVVSFTQAIDEKQKEAKLNLKLDSVAGSLKLADAQGKALPNKKLLYYSVDSKGATTPFNYNPVSKTGAKFFDTNGDGIADFISLALIDGSFGDLDGDQAGSINSSSTVGSVDLTPTFTKQANGLLTIADLKDSSTPAAVNLKATLSSNSDAANSIGYIILGADELANADPILADLDQVKQRAVGLFSSLESGDVTYNKAFSFIRELQLINGQHVRFFSVDDAGLSDLTSLSDGRFSWLEQTSNDDGSLSIAGGDNVGLILSMQSTTPGLSALIAQQQHSNPVLDFTAFTNGETVTGLIHMAREADLDAMTGFYRTLDAVGGVLDAKGSYLAPGDAGYAAAALLDSNRVAEIDSLLLADGETKDAQFSLNELSYLAPYATVGANNFFAFAAANVDGISHFKSLGDNLFGFEDTVGGGDKDFDDMVIGYSFDPLTL